MFNGNRGPCADVFNCSPPQFVAIVSYWSPTLKSRERVPRVNYAAVSSSNVYSSLIVIHDVKMTDRDLGMVEDSDIERVWPHLLALFTGDPISRVTGKDRVHFPCDFYGGMRDEDHSLRLRRPSGSLPPQRLELAGLHHSRYWVSAHQL